jgi:peptidoglycan hydrolase-like protein with peptidoglycan-binding domain
MRTKVRRLLGLAICLILVALSGTALADSPQYKPGFPCPRPDNSDVLATAICANSDMAKAELNVEKAYYVVREADGPSTYHDLKLKADADDKKLRRDCGIPLPGRPGTMPIDGASCYIKEAAKNAQDLGEDAYGYGYDEINRDIDTHIALQQKLIDDHILDSPQADGVYGDTTREAIIAWQRGMGDVATGFLSNYQAMQLITEPPPTIPPEWKARDLFQNLFSNDMLNIQVAFLESVLGPARTVTALSQNRQARTYRAMGCAVTAYVQNDVVYGYGMNISRACYADLSSFVGGTDMPPITVSSTFGQYEDGIPGSYLATCLQDCGNAQDPMVIMRYEGPHADNYIDIELGVTLGTDKAIDASEAWADAMKAEGEKWIDDGNFNCAPGGDKYQDVAAKAFAGVAPTWLFVGYGQDEWEDQAQSGCPSQ